MANARDDARAWALAGVLAGGILADLRFSPALSAAGTLPDATVFPIPQQMEALPGRFALDESAVILLPEQPSSDDLFLARSLTAELSDRYGLAIATRRASLLPGAKRTILMGTAANPLVSQYCKDHGIEVTPSAPGPEGYVLRVEGDVVLVAGSDEAGAFYGLQSLRQWIAKADRAKGLPGVLIRDWPYKPLRGLKLYLPGRNNIPFFKRFIHNFAALYKFNYLFVELNGAVRLDRHPEINAGWIELFKDLAYSRRDRPTGPHQEYQDSPNQDVADGGILEKDEVADLVRLAREHRIQVVPEVPSLTHSYYLLTRHRELADPAEAEWEWPDAYSPSNPQSYALLLDVLDEQIELFKPAMVHIGHDEWRAPLGPCPHCGGAERRELYAADVRRIHDHLAKRNVRVAIYGDHLIEAVRGRGSFALTSSSGHHYEWPGGLTPEQVEQRVPKDILIFNWFWRKSKEGEGEHNEVLLEKWGFQQVFNNFEPDMEDYARRSARPSVIGGVPSSWAATTELNFGKDLMYSFLGCANLLWSKHWPEPKELLRIVQASMPDVRRGLGDAPIPSEDGDPVVPVRIGGSFNAETGRLGFGVDFGGLKVGPVASGGKVFDLGGPDKRGANDAVIAVASAGRPASLPAESSAIVVGEDVSSLLFLHASARPAGNDWAYRYVYNFDDTADLLGHYEVVYEDGLVETIPVRYGVNILEWSWEKAGKPRAYCYRGDPIPCGTRADNPITFFAFEWVNPRLGKAIREVRLKGSTGFVDSRGRTIPDNAVILRAISVVKKRAFPEPVRARTTNAP
jgi:hypothetical protein